MIGQTLGHYRIVEKIGAGAMGVVYRARDDRLDRDVALKVLPAGTLADEASRKRFRKEALALSKLNHRHIATVYDFDSQDAVDFLVMELLPGVTLAERLAGGALPEREVAALGAQIASALEEAHEHGVIHRDLKPGNIVISPKGQAKVLDFGLAKLPEPAGDRTATETLTLTGTQTLGTLPYMAPEQLRGETADARADVFALGAVLYEMATGRRAFPEQLPTRLADAILHQPPVAPRAVNARVSPELERVILKCLEKEPEHRYPSAKDLIVDLQRLATPSTAVVTPARHHPRRNVLAAASLAVVLLVAAVLVGMNVRGWRERLLGRPGAGQIDSLAVLPLENLSRDSEQEYFADGMTEALITDLSKISALRVISRTSVMHYKGTKKTLPEIARELNVDAVVEGAVQRSGDRVRITAQLIDAGADRNLWADQYEGDLRDILALQSGVAQAIAQEIKIKLKPQERALLARAGAINPEAYQLYLKGRFYWNKRTEEGLKKALGYFQQALEKDPSNARAYAGLADCYIILAGYRLLPPKEGYPLAEAAAKKALQLDDTLAEAHTSLASFIWDYQWNWSAGLREYQRAIELNPSYATAHQWYAESLLRMGRREEARGEIERAQELDPLSLVINSVRGYIYAYGREPDRAIAQLQKTVELDANFYPAYLFLGWAFEQKGMYAEAAAQLEKAMSLPGGNTAEVVAAIGHVSAVSGEKARAAESLNQLRQRSKRSYVDPYHIALVYAGLGEREQAFQWLENAYRERSEGLTFLKVDPKLDVLRSDQRYTNLLRRMKLAE